MKAKFKSLFILLSLVSLVSCKQDVDENFDDKPFISEILVNENFLDSAIEISNTKVLKNEYFLNFYQGSNILFTNKINDDFLDNENASIVYQNSRFSKTLDQNVKVVKFKDNYIYGSNYIEIVDKNNNVIDSIGTKGFSYEIINNGSLIKNENNLFATKVFDRKVWYRVRSDNTKYLGNLKTPIKYDDFIKGPSIMENYLGSPFVKDGKPLGGFLETSVSSYGDGDTTNFVYKSADGSKLDVLKTVERTRYYYVDTPEIDHSSEGSGIKEEPWGVAAQNYTNNILGNAKHILIQSALGGSLRETYGRLLGFVWYTNVESPDFFDYKLLNYELVLNGYAKFMSGSILNEMLSNEVLYYHYFDIANEIAASKGIKIHGEIDPNYNYK